MGLRSEGAQGGLPGPVAMGVGRTGPAAGMQDVDRQQGIIDLVGAGYRSISISGRSLDPPRPPAKRRTSRTMPRRVLHDEYFNRAKAEGYVARSAYKLKQIQEHRPLIRRGMRVLDLGCAPGAWLQVAGELVGPTGQVIGLDLTPVLHQFPANVHTVVGDIYQIDPADLLGVGVATGGEPSLFDVVLSDMAPNTSGHGDHERSIRLCDRVVELLPDLLKPTGALVIKVFEGSEYPRFLKDLRERFARVKGFKPRASRDVSVEMYVIGEGYQGSNRK